VAARRAHRARRRSVLGGLSRSRRAAAFARNWRRTRGVYRARQLGRAARKTGRALFAARARLALADAGSRDRVRVPHAETRAGKAGMKNLEGFQNLPGLFVLLQL